MALTETTFCFDLRLLLQFYISIVIVVYFYLSSYFFSPIPVYRARFVLLFVLFYFLFIMFIYVLCFSGLRFYLTSCCIFVCFRCPCTLQFCPYLLQVTLSLLLFPLLLFLFHSCVYIHDFSHFVKISAYDSFCMLFCLCFFPFCCCSHAILSLFFPLF
jgi:hypothetical protein